MQYNKLATIPGESKFLKPMVLYTKNSVRKCSPAKRKEMIVTMYKGLSFKFKAVIVVKMQVNNVQIAKVRPYKGVTVIHQQTNKQYKTNQ